MRRRSFDGRIKVAGSAVLFPVLLLTSALSGCAVQGCTDGNALNYEFGANEDDGSCQFSSVVFYSAVDLGAVAVTVNVDGVDSGEISAFYPNGPGNCTAPGTVQITLTDGQTHDWDATHPTGVISTGTVRASSQQECIIVPVF